MCWYIDTCVEVYVDCIHGPILPDNRGQEVQNMTKDEIKDLQLYINPEECINCGACIPECPLRQFMKMKRLQ